MAASRPPVAAAFVVRPRNESSISGVIPFVLNNKFMHAGTESRMPGRYRKWWLVVPLMFVVTPLGVLLFADELARSVAGQEIAPPVTLPPGTQIREAPRLVRLIGAPSGGAAAVTVGRTILVPHLRIADEVRGRRRGMMMLPGDTLVVGAAQWREIIEHERVHLVQRERYGRWYLPVYVLWYLRRGYSEHPLEHEAYRPPLHE